MRVPELLPELIDRTAAEAPERDAIQFLKQTLSYGELATRTNQLAHALRSAGVKRGDRVGILAPKMAESAVAMYGIMKAGAAYVPIDPSAPVERQEFVIRDCGIRCLVTAPNQAGRLAELEAREVGFDGLFGIEEGPRSRCLGWGEIAAGSDKVPETGLVAEDLAYIIYTSGSTGTPKGIMHTHASGMAFARWAARAYGLRSEDRLSNHAPLHFDLSILDYFAGAAAGATTVIIPEAYTKLPASYTQLLQDSAVTILYTVPFAMIQMLQHGVLEERDLTALRWAIYGGEPFPPKYLRALMERLPQVRFDNIYGPAEINGCNHYTLPGPPATDEDPIPIGPVSEICEGLIVDEDDKPVAADESGELLVHTPTMMRGYWGRPDLNERAFFEDPESGKVFYRTGDHVRRVDGEILVFVGRKDRQVKTRGYRVELDEVEAAVVSHDEVAEAAAYVVDYDGETRIEAVATLNDGHDVRFGEILRHVKNCLPWYAVPTNLGVLPDFPRTTTGKIDRRALQARAQDLVSGNPESIHPQGTK